MTAPRRVLPGRTYLLTRRCLERRFYLRPDPEVTQIFEYLLAVACERFGIHLHAYVMMSNHYHLVVTDQDAKLPAFQQYFNSLLARAVNQHRKHWGAFWDRDSYNAVDLLEQHAVFDKIAYTELNPVRAHLVKRRTHWAAPTSAGASYGQQRTVSRPEGFFSDKMPRQATLSLHLPPSTNKPQAEAQRLDAITARRGQSPSPTKPLGMRRVLRQRWTSSPTTSEAHRKLRPRFASRCAQIRIHALIEYRKWIERYRTALASFKHGDRNIPFPHGSYWMCVRLGCCSSTALVRVVRGNQPQCGQESGGSWASISPSPELPSAPK